MKKLKCESCGGNIEIENEGAEFATCPYCKAKYQLNERKDVYIRLDDNVKELFDNVLNFNRKPPKFIFIPIIVFAIIMIFAITSSIMFDNKHDINNFNSDYEHYSGTNSKFFIDNLLDNVVTNNKTNKNQKITIIYNDIETTDPDTIVEIKHSLEQFKEYEVKLDYDKKGYVNKITIEDM